MEGASGTDLMWLFVRAMLAVVLLARSLAVGVVSWLRGRGVRSALLRPTDRRGHVRHAAEPQAGGLVVLAFLKIIQLS